MPDEAALKMLWEDLCAEFADEFDDLDDLAPPDHEAHLTRETDPLPYDAPAPRALSPEAAPAPASLPAAATGLPRAASSVLSSDIVGVPPPAAAITVDPAVLERLVRSSSPVASDPRVDVLQAQLQELRESVRRQEESRDSEELRAQLRELRASMRWDAEHRGDSDKVASALEAGFSRVLSKISPTSGAPTARASGTATGYDSAHWAKLVPRAEVTKLGKMKRPSLTAFVAWRRRVDRWALMAGGASMTMDDLSPREVADAAWHIIEPGLLEDLRAEGKLELSWARLQRHLRSLLGLSNSELKAALHADGQGEGESVATYITRFDEVRREIGMSGEVAKDVLIRGLNDGGTRFLTRRMETARGLCEEDADDEMVLEAISYDELLRVLRTRDWFSKSPRRANPAILATSASKGKQLAVIQEEDAPIRDVAGPSRDVARPSGVLESSTARGIFYIASGSSATSPAAPSDQAAEAVVS